MTAYRRDLAVAWEGIEFLELRDEAHAKDQVVIDELREELTLLSFELSEKDERIHRLENDLGQILVEVAENTVVLPLSRFQLFGPQVFN